MNDSRQNWNPQDYKLNARFVSDLGAPVLAWLAPRPGERILDLGCGDGALTLKMAQCGCEVVGIDASEEMVAGARLQGIDARVQDAHTMDFSVEFDAVFSNAVLHWMENPSRVVRAVYHALRPGGRFVGEFGGQGNVAAIVEAVDTCLRERGLQVDLPWYFPSPEGFGSLLEEAGFTVRAVELIPRPTPLPDDVAVWLKTFAQAYLHPLEATEREDFLAEVVERLRPSLCNEQGLWTADYVRLRFAADKPGG